MIMIVVVEQRQQRLKAAAQHDYVITAPDRDRDSRSWQPWAVSKRAFAISTPRFFLSCFLPTSLFLSFIFAIIQEYTK